MINKLVKILALVSFALVTFGVAETTSTVNFVGIVKANLGNEDGAAFDNGGDTRDDFNIKFKHTVDNVEAAINFADNTTAGTSILVFDSAYLKVNDLFDGLLSLKFYDIGFSAGKDSSILPDLGPQGIEIGLKPTDLLSITLKYGLKNDDLVNAGNRSGSFATGDAPGVKNGGTNATAFAVTENAGAFNGDLHMLSLALGLNLDILPTTIYVGAMLGDRSSSKTIDVNASGTPLQFTVEGSKIQLMNAGLTMDALAALKPGVLNIDFGMALAGDATTDYVATVADKLNTQENVTTYFSATTPVGTNLTAKQNIDFIVYAHGAADFSDSFGLSYYIRYTPDSRTKHQTLGDLNDDFFKEMFKIGVTPAYTLGQFKIALGLHFGIVGEIAAQYYDGYAGAAYGTYTSGSGATATATTTGRTWVGSAPGSYNTLEIDPSITWNIADGMSFKFFYELDYNLNGDDLYAYSSTGANGQSLTAAEDAVDHTLGMTTDITFAISGADEAMMEDDLMMEDDEMMEEN